MSSVQQCAEGQEGPQRRGGGVGTPAHGQQFAQYGATRRHSARWSVSIPPRGTAIAAFFLLLRFFLSFPFTAVKIVSLRRGRAAGTPCMPGHREVVRGLNL